MHSNLLKGVGVVATVLVAACTDRAREMSNEESRDESNVLLAEWSGHFGGVPAFDNMDLAALKPALEAGMAMNLDEVDAIASNSQPPTFENTILAMERAGRDLGRVFTYWGIWSSNLSTPEFREIQRRCCTARSKSLTSLCRLQSHPAQYVSGIPSAAILLSISHPIRCSTRCLANVRARISGPMIAL